ncbi:hypothetical protein E2C01_013906 [Portunus trituberculatus]|uniref:Uncharacterized protein n=1 Tax=Portunus trituberculatus TaxID=210409 RepID=A0A5B7DHG2_PORTR|nr:hypothetical protein [Portunus trituberculatus]
METPKKTIHILTPSSVHPPHADFIVACTVGVCPYTRATLWLTQDSRLNMLQCVRHSVANTKPQRGEHKVARVLPAMSNYYENH